MGWMVACILLLMFVTIIAWCCVVVASRADDAPHPPLRQAQGSDRLMSLSNQSGDKSLLSVEEEQRIQKEANGPQGGCE